MRKMIQRIVVVLGAALVMAIPAFAQVPVVAEAGEYPGLGCSEENGTSFQLDGRGSTVDGVRMDADLSPGPNPYPAHVTYFWTADGVEFDDNMSATPNGFFPVGETTVTLEFTYTDPDPLGPGPIVVTDTAVISVVDDLPPTVTGASDPVILWPPNHKLHEVNVALVVMDACDPVPAVVLFSLFSSEPENDIGDGNTAPDILEADVDTDDRTFLLRAERMGGGSGRVYTATYRATDAAGNFTDGDVTIRVPHDQGGSKAAKAEAKALEKMARAEAKAQAKVDKQAAKDAARAQKQAAKKNAKKGN